MSVVAFIVAKLQPLADSYLAPVSQVQDAAADDDDESAEENACPVPPEGVPT